MPNYLTTKKVDKESLIELFKPGTKVIIDRIAYGVNYARIKQQLKERTKVNIVPEALAHDSKDIGELILITSRQEINKNNQQNKEMPSPRGMEKNFCSYLFSFEISAEKKMHQHAFLRPFHFLTLKTTWFFCYVLGIQKECKRFFLFHWIFFTFNGN